MGKEIQAVLETAEAHGWRVEPTDEELASVSPTGPGPVATHVTPSDRRALQKTIAEMRRRGFRWPP
jgi:hypothetical protein